MASIHADITLVGGGIMSATLAMLLYRLDPSLHICMVEKLPEIAQESSKALNNAGTGHAGYCELNYTPQDKYGHIAINRALDINAAFEVSLQFWSHLVEADPKEINSASFINRVPHLSAVWNPQDIAYLKSRYNQLKTHPLFADMKWSEDTQTLQDWIPLMMAARPDSSHLAATRVEHGADVNFGALTRTLVSYLQKHANFQLLTHTRVHDLKRIGENGKQWAVRVLKQDSHEKLTIKTPFVFLGAGGIALHLLQNSGIPEAAGYGGFPVSGQWLICQNEELIQRHHAKVYSLAPVGAPPMSVPHLDTRIINGKKSLLFGPYAGFTTKFLKHGSSLDLIKSVKPDNIKSLLGAGKNNLDLTKYLVKEALQTHEQRMASLLTFMPDAHPDDWKLEHAGKRVQIIKRCNEKWGKLEFGTEIVASQDGSLAALLGASPGASVSVKAMLDVLERCFPDKVQTPAWQDRLKSMIPSYGSSLITDTNLAERVRRYTLATLKLSV